MVKKIANKKKKSIKNQPLKKEKEKLIKEILKLCSKKNKEVLNRISEYIVQRKNILKIKIKNYKLFKDFNAHPAGIECITELEPGYLASCGKDKKIIIYKPKTFEKHFEILDNTIINYIIYSKEKKIISATDEDIKIYSINLTLKQSFLYQKLKYHKNIIGKVIELSNGNIASCSFDGTINIYYKERRYYKLDKNLTFSKYPIECIIETDTKEICGSSSYQYKLGFWDIDNLELICEVTTYVNCGSGVLCMAGKKRMVVMNTFGCGYSIVNIENHEIIITLNLEDKFGFGIALSDGSLLLSKLKNDNIYYLEQFHYDYDSERIKKIKKIKTNHCQNICSLFEMKDHTIISACFNGGFFSGLKAGNICIWRCEPI